MTFKKILTSKTKGCFFPDIVTVRGRNEETRRLHKKRLGDYIRDTGETSESRPVWKQQNGDHILSYTPQKEWAVSLRNKLMNRQDMVIKSKDKGSLLIPSSGWMTQDSKKWTINMELEVQGMSHFPDVCMYVSHISMLQDTLFQKQSPSDELAQQEITLRSENTQKQKELLREGQFGNRRNLGLRFPQVPSTSCSTPRTTTGWLGKTTIMLQEVSGHLNRAYSGYQALGGNTLMDQRISGSWIMGCR